MLPSKRGSDARSVLVLIVGLWLGIAGGTRRVDVGADGPLSRPGKRSECRWRTSGGAPVASKVASWRAHVTVPATNASVLMYRDYFRATFPYEPTCSE